MLNSKEISKIEASQSRQGKVRNTAFKVLKKAGLSGLASKVINGDRLTKTEIKSVFEVAEGIKPIPDNKAKLVFWALINPLHYRHFNQFGQELK
tara:strand:+ start:104 stop:385 length:282 start_codon:yes stop_codon:yes gene_type:complete